MKRIHFTGKGTERELPLGHSFQEKNPQSKEKNPNPSLREGRQTKEVWHMKRRENRSTIAMGVKRGFKSD